MGERKLLYWAKLAAGALLLAVLLHGVDWRAASATLGSADPATALSSFLVLAATIPLCAWRWGVLLRPGEVDAGLNRLVRAYWIGTFFSNFLPTSVGGDAARLVTLRGRGPLAAIAASIMVERLTGLAVLLLLVAVGLLARPELFGPPTLATSLGLVAAGLGIALTVPWFGLPRGLPLPALRTGTGRLGRSLAVKLAPLASALSDYRSRPRRIAAALALSFPYYWLLAASQYLLLAAVAAPLPAATVCLVAPVIPLVSLFPLTINGLGVTEGAFVLLYVAAGAPPEAALAAAVLRRLGLLAVSSVGGLLWLSGREQAAATRP